MDVEGGRVSRLVAWVWSLAMLMDRTVKNHLLTVTVWQIP